MKHMTILGIFALVMLLVMPGAVSAADVQVSGSVVKPDLVVTAISPNVGYGAYMFANGENFISVTVKNQGTAAADASTLSIDVEGTVYTETIGTLAVDATQTVTVTDPTSYAHGASVTVTATADSLDVINEGVETNNDASNSLAVYWNGYRGKHLTDGSDIATYKTFDLRGDVIYSVGDSAYLSNSQNPGWTTYSVAWAEADLPIPTGATVEEARLYVTYTYDRPNPAERRFPDYIGMSFNSQSEAYDAWYVDEKYWSTSYPYGMMAWDVTDEYIAGGNSATLSNTYPGGAGVSLRGMVLVVVYEDASETLKKIIINEEFDLLYGNSNGATYGSTSAQGTAYAPFGNLDTTDVSSATLITIAPGAIDAGGEGELLFNGQIWNNAWNKAGATELGINVKDVSAYLQSTGNEAGFQSSSDWMEASNAILIVEYEEGAVTADFSADPTSGDKPLTVAFTDESTGYIVGYEWTFGDGETSTDANPSHEYTDCGTYTVSLTVTGVGSSDTETKTDYITVLEPAPVVDFTGTPTSGTSPLTVAFTATNTGGAVTSYDWTFGDGTTETTTANTVSHTYTTATPQTYTVSLIAHGPDYDSSTETKTNYISVGAQIIEVTVDPASIDFGTMQAGVDETGSTGVSVDVTGGTAWSVDASATNGGYMGTGTADLANAFQLANGGGAFQAMTSDYVGFMTGAQDEDRTDTANVLQSIDAADAPGAYSITLTFTGGFV